MVAEPVPMVFKTGSSAGKVKQGKITNEDVLRREVPWSAFKEKGIISKDELELMYQLVEIVQSKSVAAQAALIEMRSAEHAQLFKALLTGVNKDEVVMYILSLLDELLKQKPTLASLFLAALYESGGAIDVFEPMLKLLSRRTRALERVRQELPEEHAYLAGEGLPDSSRGHGARRGEEGEGEPQRRAPPPAPD